MIRQLYCDGTGFRHVPPAICYCYHAYMASAGAGSRALSNLRLLNGVMHSLWATFPFYQSIHPRPRASFRFLSPFRVYASPHPTQRVSPKPKTILTYSTYIAPSYLYSLSCTHTTCMYNNVLS
jgi:hypothetical protein